jgi:glycosyltransferase involved in cell wall biosynthesis
MKVLHLITGLCNGGAEANLYRLVTSDEKNSHYVVSLMNHGIYGDALIGDGISVYALDMPRGRLTLKGVCNLYTYLRMISPDVVQTWMYHADLLGGLVARLAGVKTVVWGIRGPLNWKRMSLRTRAIVRLCVLLSRIVPTSIISNSRHAAVAHIEAGYPKAKMVIIANGYSVNEFRPSRTAKFEMKICLGLKSDIVLIGMVARFDPHKDHENLFAALEILSQKNVRMCFLLVGPDMTKANRPLVELLDKYGVEDMVQLSGPCSNIPRVMAALDLHVLSSVAESFPNVLAEAMACCTPCVTTDVGDAALIVGDTGWIVPPSNSIALAEAIESALNMMKDPVVWNDRKKASRRRIKEVFSIDTMIAAYTNAWLRFMTKDQPR